jgi:hypothetical protein
MPSDAASQRTLRNQWKPASVLDSPDRSMSMHATVGDRACAASGAGGDPGRCQHAGSGNDSDHGVTSRIDNPEPCPVPVRQMNGSIHSVIKPVPSE